MLKKFEYMRPSCQGNESVLLSCCFTVEENLIQCADVELEDPIMFEQEMQQGIQIVSLINFTTHYKIYLQ
jgi:flagellar assembly factor FliW